MTVRRCLLVDDERLARSNLRALLRGHADISIVGEAAGVAQAEEAIRTFKPDLVFLDIQLPDGDGFDLLERLEHPPRIIFVTAFDRYAVRAFEVNALDYLLKPIDPDRLAQALARLDAVMPAVPLPPLLPDDALLIPVGQSGYFIRTGDILVVTVEGNYTTITTLNGRTHTVLNTLSDWERRLPASLFFKVDRAHILNLRQIRKVEPLGRHARIEMGTCSLTLDLKRAASNRLRQVLKDRFVG